MIEIKDASKSYCEPDGPILLLAGPGTGKTWQLAMRIKFLIEDLATNPDEIAVITFTNEAAKNMRHRLFEPDINLTPDRMPGIISTMHSLGNTIIGSSPESFGLTEEYSVLNEKEPQEVLIKDASQISGSPDLWKKASEYRCKGEYGNGGSGDLQTICENYIGILRKCSLIDYDDQIYLACEALKKNEEVRNYWQKKTKYLLVDEYQDINQAQFNFIRELSVGQESGLFVVGDDDQSIYSFRGGTPKFIIDFEKHYGDKVKVGCLSKSWRCPENILTGAQAMLKEFYKESVPKPKSVFSDKLKENNKIIYYDVPTDEKEAQIIAGIIAEKIKANTIKIIVPNVNYLPWIKNALKRKKIPFYYRSSLSTDGLLRFLCLTNWIEDPHNNLKLRFLIDLIINNHDDLIKEIVSEEQKITKKREIASFEISNLWKDVHHDHSLFQLIESQSLVENPNPFFVKLIECLKGISKLYLEKGTSRTGLTPFLEKSGLFVSPGRNPNGLISEIKEWKSELSLPSSESVYEVVNIYNMPSSKGLEADVIFVIGLSNELFPNPKGDIEEQSRLFYVAMTRAKKELYLFNARTRSSRITYQKASYQLKRSPFISSIPKICLDEKYIKNKNQGGC